MNRKIRLRAHHIARFADYYLNYAYGIKGGYSFIKNYYHPEFLNKVKLLFDSLTSQKIKLVKVVNGTDSICDLCRKYNEYNKIWTDECSNNDEMQSHPQTLFAMAKSQLIVGKSYSIEDFLKQIGNIKKNYSSRKIQGLISLAYAEWR